MDKDTYTYRISYAVEDQEYVGTCLELPSTSWLDETPEKALAGIRKRVAEIVADMKRNGEPLPVPFAFRTFSGKFQVRIPPEAHRRLAEDAAAQNISINRLVTSRLLSDPK